jgi:hypothetical protein
MPDQAELSLETLVRTRGRNMPLAALGDRRSRLSKRS